MNFIVFESLGWVGGFAFEQNVLFGGNKEFVYLNKMQAKKTVGWVGEFLG